MSVQLRKLRVSCVGLGVAVAIAAALPCGAADTAPAGAHKGGSAEENIGVFSGLAVGALAGGPIGAVAGGVVGALLGDHYHKQKLRNRQLAIDVSQAEAERVKLSRNVAELHSGLEAARAQDAHLAQALDQVGTLAISFGFRTADAHLSQDETGRLMRLGSLAGGIPGVKVRVSGYADPRGSRDYNDALSKDRADTVATVLLNSGLGADRIIVEAWGSGDAAKDGDLDTYALERQVRVQFEGVDSAAVSATPVASNR